jgi:hypothetical protein
MQGLKRFPEVEVVSNDSTFMKSVNQLKIGDLTSLCLSLENKCGVSMESAIAKHTTNNIWPRRTHK